MRGMLSPSSPRRLTVTGLAVALVPAFVTVLLLVGVGRVPPGDVLSYSAYILWTVLLPGAVLWTLVDDEGTARPRWESMALGAGVGFAGEAVTYLAATAAGTPKAVLLWPLAPIGLWMLRVRQRPELRRRTRSHGGLGWMVVAAALMTVTAVAISRNRWRAYPADQPAALLDRDEAFHLALTTELMHHGPETYPYVAGTPLEYHWGSYAHVAAAAWGTGTEPAVIVRTLAPTTFLALTLVVVMVVARRWWNSPAAGVVALALVTLASLPDVFGWSRWRAPLLGPLLPLNEHFTSPSQGLAQAILLPTLLVARQVLARGPRLPDLVVFGVLVSFLALVKPPFPLLVLAGCAAALVVTIVRRTARRAASCLVLTTALSFATIAALAFGGSSRTTTLLPLHALVEPTARATGLAARADAPAATLLVLLAAAVGIFAIAGVAVAPVFRHEDTTSTALLVGVVLGGVGAWLLLGHVYGSEAYFLHGAMPVMACLVAGGVALGASRLGRRTSRSTAALAGVAGLVWLLVVGKGTARFTPALPTSATDQLVIALLLPLAVWAVGVLGVVVIVTMMVPRARVAVPLVVATFAVTTMLPAAVVPLGLVASVPGDPPVTDAIGVGGVEAARWLRENSSPSQLVATNSHCYSPTERPCVSHSFWVSAFTERRVLVEGWGFIPRGDQDSIAGAPAADSDTRAFWDQDLLRVNDAAFAAPSVEVLSLLRAEEGVDWLFVDTRLGARVDELERLTTVVHRSGDYVVVRL